MLTQTLLMMCILLAILCIFSRKKHVPQYHTYKPAYESAHVEVYDLLVYDENKNKEELTFINPVLTQESNVLDVGSGTGHHVHALHQLGVNTMGMDLSNDMVTKSSKKFPHVYIQGDALNMTTFQPESFTHITCLYYTIYYMKQKQQFFQNAYHWLMPGGYLILHTSKQWDYGPTSILRGDLRYSSKLTSNKFRECITVKDKEQHVVHTVYMEPEHKLIDMAQHAGFTVYSVHSYSYPYKNQHLYLLVRGQ